MTDKEIYVYVVQDSNKEVVIIEPSQIEMVTEMLNVKITPTTTDLLCYTDSGFEVKPYTILLNSVVKSTVLVTKLTEMLFEKASVIDVLRARIERIPHDEVCNGDASVKMYDFELTESTYQPESLYNLMKCLLDFCCIDGNVIKHPQRNNLPLLVDCILQTCIAVFNKHGYCVEYILSTFLYERLDKMVNIALRNQIKSAM